MRWDSPQVMRDWCVQAAMDHARVGVDYPTRWCDQMVDWMNDRMGDSGD